MAKYKFYTDAHISHAKFLWVMYGMSSLSTRVLIIDYEKLRKQEYLKENKRRYKEEVMEMMIRKKDRMEDRSGKKYEIAGKWNGNFVLSPVEASEEECLGYTAKQMLEFIETGYFTRVRGEKK